jgi:hypothetical protein
LLLERVVPEVHVEQRLLPVHKVHPEIPQVKQLLLDRVVPARQEAQMLAELHS